MARMIPEVAEYVGNDPVELDGFGDPRAFAGNGYVAKVGLPDSIERERMALTLESLPMPVPHVIDWDISWIVEEEIKDAGTGWSDDDLVAALEQLAAMHDRFEGSAVLESPVIRRPLGRDLNELMSDARASGWVLPGDLGEMLMNPSPLVDVLRLGPQTLLHGDPWPFHLRRSGGEIFWLDWTQVSMGPAAADLASWLDQAPFHVGRPIDRLTHINAYIEARQTEVDKAVFFAGLDSARLLWFLAYDVPNLPGLAEQSPDLAEKMNEEALRALDAFRNAASKV